MEPNYQPGPYNNPQDDSIDFKRYLSLFISNWYWFAIALFISISIAYGINRWSEEQYTVSSTILIKDQEFGGGAPDLSNIFPGTGAFKSEQNLRNEIGILRSYSLNKRVMKALTDFHVVYVNVGKRGIAETRMYKSAPFRVVYDSLEKQIPGLPVFVKILSVDSLRIEFNGSLSYKKNIGFGDRFNEMGFDFRINADPASFYYDPENSNRYYFYFIGPEVLANQYRGSLGVTPVEEDATLVTLSVSGPVPLQLSDYLNKLMDEYLQQGLDVKNQTADKTIEFIDDQIGSVSDSLRLVENSLEDFRLSNRLIDLSREGSYIQARLEAFENERSSLFLQKQYYNYLAGYIESKNESGDLVSPGTMGVTNSSLERLVGELASLQQQKNKLRMNIAEDLPAVRIIDEGIKDVKALITENTLSSLKSLEDGLEDIEQRIKKVELELDKLPGTERRLINIQRKFDLNNTVYNYLLEKKAEAGIARASTVSDNRVIDYADDYNANRIKPESRQNYIMAFMLGLFIPVALILLIDYLNNKIIDQKDIEKGTRAPVIGYISHNKLRSETPVSERPGSTLSESFRSVRTNLKYFLKESQNPVIAISSTISAEGKTFISTNLATILASNKLKVLLVGLDLRKPRIHKILGISNETGLSNYLAGQQSFEDTVHSTRIDNLWYAPSGPVPPNPAELIDSVEMKKFIAAAKERFDYIILDTPPVALVTDALLLAQITDLYLFVVRQRYSSKNTLGLIEDLNRSHSFRNLAIIINDINITGYYGYGLRYGNALGYSYSYGYNYYGSGYYGRYGYRDRDKGYYTEE